MLKRLIGTRLILFFTTHHPPPPPPPHHKKTQNLNFTGFFFKRSDWFNFVDRLLGIFADRILEAYLRARFEICTIFYNNNFYVVAICLVVFFCCHLLLSHFFFIVVFIIVVLFFIVAFIDCILFDCV